MHSALNLGLDIRIPPEYIADEHQRLRAYKRIADANEEERGGRIREELADRYGPPPEAVKTLLQFSLLKSMAERAGVESIDRRQGFANIKFHQQSKIDPFRLMALVRNTSGAQFTPAGVLKFPLSPSIVSKELLEVLRKTLGELTNEAPIASEADAVKAR